MLQSLEHRPTDVSISILLIFVFELPLSLEPFHSLPVSYHSTNATILQHSKVISISPFELSLNLVLFNSLLYVTVYTNGVIWEH